MKSRLSGTIWMLTILNGVALFTVLGLAYSAGKQASGGTGFEPSGLIIPALIAVGMSIVLVWRLGAAFLGPVNELSEFSERLAAAPEDAVLRFRGPLHNGAQGLKHLPHFCIGGKWRQLEFFAHP